LAPDRMRAPNPECPVCSVAQATLYVDMSRATLHDVVEDFLRLELGYGDEFVVNNEIGTLYDVEETDNLAKKLIDLGIKSDTFLTVIDEDEENPRVNLLINVQASANTLDDKPFKFLEAQADGLKAALDIPRRRKSASSPQAPDAEDITAKTISVAKPSNGASEIEPDTAKGGVPKKRMADDVLEGDGQKSKRGKTTSSGDPADGDNTIHLEDDTDGAIVIDD